LVHPEQAADFEKKILEDEQEWTAQFDATTDEQWARMAEMARRDIAAGNLSLEGFLEQYAQRSVSPEEWNEVSRAGLGGGAEGLDRRRRG
jgi:hypothetical protein